MSTSETPKKKSTSRAEAGLVEEGYEVPPNDEAIAAGEAIDWDAQAETDALIETPQSGTVISGMSQEEQGMEMTPVVVGPPAYGSPDPVTSASRLLPLDQHPFNPENVPEDSPVRIDPDYGKGYDGTISPGELGQSFPGAPGRTDLETDQLGTEEGGEQGATVQASEQTTAYDSQTRADLLAEADSRGLTGLSNATKADIITALIQDDAA